MRERIENHHLTPALAGVLAGLTYGIVARTAFAHPVLTGVFGLMAWEGYVMPASRVDCFSSRPSRDIQSYILKIIQRRCEQSAGQLYSLLLEGDPAGLGSRWGRTMGS